MQREKPPAVTQYLIGLEYPQLLVDAFARGTQHKAQILLRDAKTNPDAVGCVLAVNTRESQQASCEAASHITEHGVLDDVADPAQTFTENFQQAPREVRTLFDERNESFAADEQQFG